MHHGPECWYKCDTKSQARVLHGRLKARDTRGLEFPAKTQDERNGMLYRPLSSWNDNAWTAQYAPLWGILM
jgi:hypothetical protein